MMGVMILISWDCKAVETAEIRAGQQVVLHPVGSLGHLDGEEEGDVLEETLPHRKQRRLV
jgi:hypothetical protein